MQTTKTLSIALALAAAATTTAQTSLEIIQSNGDQAVGLPAGNTVTIGSSNPSVDLNGNFTWTNTLAGPDVVTISTLSPFVPKSNLAVYYGRTNADMVMVVRDGDQVPGMPAGYVIASRSSASATFLGGGLGFNGARIATETGDLLIGCDIAVDPASSLPITYGSTVGDDEVLLYGKPGNLQILARQNVTPAPGLPGAVLTDNSGFAAGQDNYMAMAPDGTAWFKALIVDPTGTHGITSTNDGCWISGTPGNLNIAIREEESLFGGAQHIHFVPSVYPALDRENHILFECKLSSTLGTSPATAGVDDWALILRDMNPGGVDKYIARAGDTYGTGTIASAASSPFIRRTTSMSSTGQHIVMAATLTGTPGGTTDDSCLLISSGGSTATMLVQEGNLISSLPGAPSIPGFPNAKFSTFGSTAFPVGDDNGTPYTMFEAYLVDGPVWTHPTAGDLATQALFCGSPASGFKVLAYKDMPVPEVGPNYKVGRWASGTPGYVNGSGIVNGGEMGFSHHANSDNIPYCEVMVYDPTATGAENLQVVFVEDPLKGRVIVALQGQPIGSTGEVFYLSGLSHNHSFGSGDGQLAFSGNREGAFKVQPVSGKVMIARARFGSLTADTASIPTSGGTQTIELDASPAHAFKLYSMVGSLSGSRPGFDVLVSGTNYHLPINADVWFTQSILLAGGSMYPGTWGITDANGKATSPFVFPAGFGWLVGSTFHHTIAVIGTSGGVSIDHITAPASCHIF